jgi:hypothetical protein
LVALADELAGDRNKRNLVEQALAADLWHPDTSRCAGNGKNLPGRCGA